MAKLIETSGDRGPLNLHPLLDHPCKKTIIFLRSWKLSDSYTVGKTMNKSKAPCYMKGSFPLALVKGPWPLNLRSLICGNCGDRPTSLNTRAWGPKGLQFWMDGNPTWSCTQHEMDSVSWSIEFVQAQFKEVGLIQTQKAITLQSLVQYLIYCNLLCGVAHMDRIGMNSIWLREWGITLHGKVCGCTNFNFDFPWTSCVGPHNFKVIV